jgi:hypothetical protein
MRRMISIWPLIRLWLARDASKQLKILEAAYQLATGIPAKSVMEIVMWLFLGWWQYVTSICICIFLFFCVGFCSRARLLQTGKTALQSIAVISTAIQYPKPALQPYKDETTDSVPEGRLEKVACLQSHHRSTSDTCFEVRVRYRSRWAHVDGRTYQPDPCFLQQKEVIKYAGESSQFGDYWTLSWNDIVGVAGVLMSWGYLLGEKSFSVKVRGCGRCKPTTQTLCKGIERSNS